MTTNNTYTGATVIEDGYMILEAPNGYAGHFDESALPSGWKVEYETSAAFLKFPQPFVITVR